MRFDQFLILILLLACYINCQTYTVTGRYPNQIDLVCNASTEKLLWYKSPDTLLSDFFTGQISTAYNTFYQAIGANTLRLLQPNSSDVGNQVYYGQPIGGIKCYFNVYLYRKCD